jgi:CRP/FNR family transcriptional regulator, cyclic AMP receptor protein
MPAGGTARSRNGEKARSASDGKGKARARARARPSKDFDTQEFLTTVGAGRTIAT